MKSDKQGYRADCCGWGSSGLDSIGLRHYILDWILMLQLCVC